MSVDDTTIPCMQYFCKYFLTMIENLKKLNSKIILRNRRARIAGTENSSDKNLRLGLSRPWIISAWMSCYWTLCTTFSGQRLDVSKLWV